MSTKMFARNRDKETHIHEPICFTSTDPFDTKHPKYLLHYSQFTEKAPHHTVSTYQTRLISTERTIAFQQLLGFKHITFLVNQSQFFIVVLSPSPSVHAANSLRPMHVLFFPSPFCVDQISRLQHKSMLYKIQITHSICEKVWDSSTRFYFKSETTYFIYLGNITTFFVNL